MIFVVAALLWVAVLVPAWMRRREFRNAEQNAVRLQRTLRVLAETAEMPDEVRVVASAREAVAHERLLQTARKRQDAERAAELSAAKAEQVKAELEAQRLRRRQAALGRAAKLQRPLARRVRAVAALVALLGVVGVLVGAGVAIATQLFAVLMWSGLAAALSVGTLVLLAPGRVRHAEIPQERLAPGGRALSEAAIAAPTAADDNAEEAAARARAEAHAVAQSEAAARIDRARAMARARAERPEPRVNQEGSMLLGSAVGGVADHRTTHGARSAAAAQAVPASSSSTSGAASAAAPAADSVLSQLSSMGVVGDTSAGMPDLDAVLRKRRSAG